MDRISILNIFLRVAQTGSFTTAAESLEISRSRVTRAVKSLEEELGVQLFLRTTRKVTLTTSGRDLQERAKELVTLSDTMYSDIQERAGLAPAGRLRLASTVIIGWVFVQRTVVEFRRRYPKVSVELITEDHDLDLVENGIDIAFKVGNHLPPGAIAHKIGAVHSYLAASPEYLAKHFVPKVPADLEKLDFLQNLYLGNTTRIWNKQGETIDLPLRGSYVCNNAFLNLNACMLGLGIAMLPRDYIGPFLDDGKLVRVLPDWEGEVYDFYALTATRHLSTSARLFLNFVNERLQTVQGRVYALGLEPN